MNIVYHPGRESGKADALYHNPPASGEDGILCESFFLEQQDAKLKTPIDYLACSYIGHYPQIRKLHKKDSLLMMFSILWTLSMRSSCFTTTKTKIARIALLAGHLQEIRSSTLSVITRGGLTSIRMPLPLQRSCPDCVVVSRVGWKTVPPLQPSIEVGTCEPIEVIVMVLSKRR